jgi:hypothetical protein
VNCATFELFCLELPCGELTCGELLCDKISCKHFCGELKECFLGETSYLKFRIPKTKFGQFTGNSLLNKSQGGSIFIANNLKIYQFTANILPKWQFTTDTIIRRTFRRKK